MGKPNAFENLRICQGYVYISTIHDVKYMAKHHICSVNSGVSKLSHVFTSGCFRDVISATPRSTPSFKIFTCRLVNG